jgi:predicted Zn-dependent protease
MILRLSLYACLISAFIWLISCAVNPVTGKREFMLVSESDEIALGKESDPQIVAQYGVYNDAKLNQYLSDLGNRMAQISHRPQLKYEFKIVDSPIINAFAVPGGYVYFTRGIMAYLNNEAELAGVLGHEIGHITARHSAQQMSQAQLAQVGLGVGSVLSPTFAQFAGMAGTGIQVLFLKFGRDHERQSDQLGVEYSTKIGYDAREMANFFATLDRMQSTSDGGGLPGWLSTHPQPEERVVNVRQMAEERQQTLDVSQLKINRNEYLQMIDGIVFGEDPRHGYVDGNMFYHPDLKFQFPIPANWKTVNTPSKVGMISADEKAMMILTVASGSSLAEIENAFVQQFGVSVINSTGKTVNGLPARVLVGDVPQQEGVIRLMSYFIQYGNLIYVLYGYTYQPTFETYRPMFEATMNGFKELKDQSKINVQPTRVRIKTVPKTATLQEALKSFKVKDEMLEETSLINGMLLTDTVQANSKIKVVER